MSNLVKSIFKVNPKEEIVECLVSYEEFKMTESTLISVLNQWMPEDEYLLAVSIDHMNFSYYEDKHDKYYVLIRVDKTEDIPEIEILDQSEDYYFLEHILSILKKESIRQGVFYSIVKIPGSLYK